MMNPIKTFPRRCAEDMHLPELPVPKYKNHYTELSCSNGRRKRCILIETTSVIAGQDTSSFFMKMTAKHARRKTAYYNALGTTGHEHFP